MYDNWPVNTDPKEPVDVSTAPLTSSNNPATSSQHASAFDFNEFFSIDSVSLQFF